ncbi:hypothetical protein [Brevundimonas sp.]
MTNCTGGEADLALLPVLLGLGVVCAGVLAVLRPGKQIALLLLAASAPLLLTASTVSRVAIGWFRGGATACQTLTGGPYPADGSEGLTLYMLAEIAAIFILCLAAARPRKN